MLHAHHALLQAGLCRSDVLNSGRIMDVNNVNVESWSRGQIGRAGKTERLIRALEAPETPELEALVELLRPGVVHLQLLK